MRRWMMVAAMVCAMSCGEAVDDAQLNAVLALDGDATAGEVFYGSQCERCHGPGGNGDGQGPKLAGKGHSDEKIVKNLLRGPRGMPSYNNEDDQTLADVTAYVSTL